MQGSNPGLLHCRQTLYCLSHQRSPSKKAVCKPSLDGYESEIGREGSSEAAIPVPQPDSLLLALVYRGDVKTGELGCSSLEQTSMLHFESAKKKKNQQQGEGGSRGSMLRPTPEMGHSEHGTCVLRTGRTATKSPHHAYDPQMAPFCETSHLCF